MNKVKLKEGDANPAFLKELEGLLVKIAENAVNLTYVDLKKLSFYANKTYNPLG